MEEVPLLIELQKKYANDAVVVGVSVDTNISRVDAVIKEKGITYPILANEKGFDGPIPTTYHIQGTPDLFVLDRAGRIFARLTSAKTLEATLQEALAKAR